MARYYCKCGRSFQKSGDSGTTGYRLKDYGLQHECYGCLYALAVKDGHWNKETNSWDYTIRAWECRASQHLNYGTYAALTPGSKNSGSIYSLDFDFLEEAQAYVQESDGISTDGGKPGERSAQYGTDGLYRLPVYPDQNKKGIAAKQALFERFFHQDGTRNDMDPEREREIVLEQIKRSKEVAKALNTYYAPCGQKFCRAAGGIPEITVEVTGKGQDCFGCPHSLHEPETDEHALRILCVCSRKMAQTSDTSVSLTDAAKTPQKASGMQYRHGSRIYFVRPQPDGTYRAFFYFVTEPSDVIVCGSIPPAKTSAQAQDYLDAYAKEHGYEIYTGPEKSVLERSEFKNENILKRIEDTTMGKINVGNIAAGLNKVKGITQSLKNVAKHEMIPVEYIKAGYDNPYAANDTTQSRYKLAMSIQANGLLNPLLVNKKSNTEYWLISGEHRLNAIKENLRWRTVSCMVYDNISDNIARLMLHAVNLDVREYTTGQKLQFYQQMEQLLTKMRESGEYTGAIQQGIAETLRVSTRQVRKYKKITEQLSPEIQQKIIDGEISIDKGYQMAMPPAPPKEANTIGRSGSPSGFEPNSTAGQLLQDGWIDQEPIATTGSPSDFSSEKGYDHIPQNGGGGQESPATTGSASDFGADFWDEKIKYAIKDHYDCEKLFGYYKSQIPTVQEAIKDILKPPYGYSGRNFSYPDHTQGDFTRRPANAEIESYDGKTRHRCTLTYSQIDAYIRQMIRTGEFDNRQEKQK